MRPYLSVLFVSKYINFVLVISVLPCGGPSPELFQLYFLIITDIPNSILLLIKGYKMNGDVSQGDGSTGGGANSTKPLNLVSS